MANLGGYMHRAECANVVWPNMAFAAIRACNGKIEDTNLMANWLKAGVNPKRMLYDNPGNDPALSVYDACSFFVSAINNLQATQGQGWRDNPIIVNINQPYIDLLYVNTYIQYLEDKVLKAGHPKTLLFTTPEKWTAIQINSPDGEHMRDNILTNAELMVSEYGDIANPTKPFGIGKVCWWEYKQGFFEYNAMGQFNHVVSNPDTTGDTTPGTPPVVTSSINLRLECLKLACDVEIQLKPANSGAVQLQPILDLADKFIEYVKKA